MTIPTYDFEFDCEDCGTHFKGSSIHPERQHLCFDCQRTRENIAAGCEAKNCERCGKQIAPRREAQHYYCSNCGYQKYCEDYEDAYQDVIEFLQERVSAKTSMWHTGGGCMAIGIQGDEYYLMVTDAEGPLYPRTEHTGWLVGVYDSENVVLDGTDPDGYEVVHDPSLEALGVLIEQFLVKIRDKFGVTEWEYKRTMKELSENLLNSLEELLSKELSADAVEELGLDSTLRTGSGEPITLWDVIERRRKDKEEATVVFTSRANRGTPWQQTSWLILSSRTSKHSIVGLPLAGSCPQVGIAR